LLPRAHVGRPPSPALPRRSGAAAALDSLPCGT